MNAQYQQTLAHKALKSIRVYGYRSHRPITPPSTAITIASRLTSRGQAGMEPARRITRAMSTASGVPLTQQLTFSPKTRRPRAQHPGTHPL